MIDRLGQRLCIVPAEIPARMSARIVLVHDDAAVAEPVSAALTEQGFEVLVYPDPLVALGALENAGCMGLLITRVQFAEGLSNGRALALMGLTKRSDLRVLFVCRPENRGYVEDLGEVLMTPVAVSEIVEAATRLMQCAAASA